LPPEDTAACRARGFIRRNARQLHSIIEAAGVQWLLDNLALHRDRLPTAKAIALLKAELFPVKQAEKETSQAFNSETFLPFDDVPF